MRLVILDDLSNEPMTPKQEKAIGFWFNRLEKICPHGEMQVFSVTGEKASRLLRTLLEGK